MPSVTAQSSGSYSGERYRRRYTSILWEEKRLTAYNRSMSFNFIDSIKAGPEYLAIQTYYGNRTAARSVVPLMNHINEGLIVLNAVNASSEAMAGFCLHPLFQNDEELTTVGYQYTLDRLGLPTSIRALMLTMEYRRVANKYLADCDTTKIELSPLKEVNDMLIADKVQNRKDFLKYHYGKHPNSTRLDEYFKEWLATPGISEARYSELITLLP